MSVFSARPKANADKYNGRYAKIPVLLYLSCGFHHLSCKKNIKIQPYVIGLILAMQMPSFLIDYIEESSHCGWGMSGIVCSHYNGFAAKTFPAQTRTVHFNLQQYVVICGGMYRATTEIPRFHFWLLPADLHIFAGK